MKNSIFISYSHKDGKWIWDRLIPCLRAGHAIYKIDKERFEVGKSVIGQMDEIQDSCNKLIVVLSPNYISSDYCQHEFNRAILKDPEFKNGNIIPIILMKCNLPEEILKNNPIYVDMCKDNDDNQWDILLKACDAKLDVAAPHWLQVRDEIRRHLKRNESVNLVVKGNPNWRELICELRSISFPNLGEVDLQKPATTSRRGLIKKIMEVCGVLTDVPPEPEDLVYLGENFENRLLTYIAFTHFDLVVNRPQYGIDLFSSLRYLMMEDKKLVLLIHSRDHFANLLPPNNPLSNIEIKTVILKGK